MSHTTTLTWNLIGDSIRAHSNVYHDEGSLLDYWLESNGDDTWVAHFEVHTLLVGPLSDAIQACEASEKEAAANRAANTGG
jgi:hypothetical protein